jgi:DNA-binding GntR family transcriptional regulator
MQGRKAMTIEIDNDVSAGELHEDLRIVRALEEDIIFGRLAPGTRLTEDSLLSRFPVTRHFVRQALVQLEQMGIVVRERNKGATVRSLTAEEVRQIYEVRELVQRQAALWIPLPAPDRLIEQLMAIHEEHGRHIESGYLRGVHETNDRFHLTLFGACGNKYLVQTIELYMRFSLPVRANSMSDRASLDVSHNQHRLMIEMLKGRDNWVLAQLCVDHLQPSKRRYIDLVVGDA